MRKDSASTTTAPSEVRPSTISTSASSSIGLSGLVAVAIRGLWRWRRRWRKLETTHVDSGAKVAKLRCLHLDIVLGRKLDAIESEEPVTCKSSKSNLTRSGAPESLRLGTYCHLASELQNAVSLPLTDNLVHRTCRLLPYHPGNDTSDNHQEIRATSWLTLRKKTVPKFRKESPTMYTLVRTQLSQ